MKIVGFNIYVSYKLFYRPGMTGIRPIQNFLRFFIYIEVSVLKNFKKKLQYILFCPK